MRPLGLTLAMTLTLNFQGQILNLLYLTQKWSDCHETKSKHIDWTQGLKCDHGVWHWPWPWLEFSRSNMEFAISQSKVIRRSGVRIYKIVTGVTSDVGVPSTHLVCFKCIDNLSKITFQARLAWIKGMAPFMRVLLFFTYDFATLNV